MTELPASGPLSPSTARSSAPSDQQGKGRRQLLMIACLFALPLIVAMALNTPWFRLKPEATRNYGRLIQPVIPLADLGLAEPGAEQGRGSGRWTLLWLPESPPASAGQTRLDCSAAIDLLSRVRKAEGRAYQRIAVAYSAQCQTSDLPDLMPMAEGVDVALRTRLEPAGLWLIDPLGNAMMYYPEQFDASRLQRDLDRLLRYSKAGQA